MTELDELRNIAKLARTYQRTRQFEVRMELYQALDAYYEGEAMSPTAIDHSQDPITQEEAARRFHTTTRHTLAKGQLRKLYGKTATGEALLTAKWETHNGRPVLVGNGLTVTFMRSKAGAVVGVVVQK